ncbi:hypothetical protein RND71_042625 [Anisodus tanguticus]|uniref:Uncharacterized protein n=1 Tax=Anisodus tanguticus TaxID=243964 RepID=A0AAE1UN57_9SOLA|nr:hypothetical protein RND71_042625 [Anisodus tanguticus]
MLEDVFMDHMAARMIDHIATKIDDDENLVDVLLKIQKSENQLTCDNIKAVIWVWPGEKENSNNLDWAISEMLKNPMSYKNPNKGQNKSSVLMNLSMGKRGESWKLASKYSMKKLGEVASAEGYKSNLSTL